MSRNPKFDSNLFLLIFRLLDEGYCYTDALKKCNVEMNHDYLRFKYRQFKLHGIDALEQKKSNNSYSKTFKKSVVQEYFTQNSSINYLAIKYNIPSTYTVKTWIKRYTLGKENVSYSPFPEVYLMKARKTTFEERIEIVESCIESEKDFKKTALKFNVNYGQVYSWVKKYEKFGSAGLVDGRGKGKSTQAMTDEEQIIAKTKALEERIKYLEMENKILKKLKEKEREMINRHSGK